MRLNARTARCVTIFAILPASTARLAAQQPRTGIDPANLDTTCAPCTDFYHYANGGWISRTTIPATEPMWSAINEITERVDSTLHTIFSDASRDRSSPPGAPMQLIGAYYRSCMDTAVANARSLALVAPLLASIDSIRGAADVGRAVSRLQARGVPVVFGFGSDQDARD